MLRYVDIIVLAVLRGARAAIRRAVESVVCALGWTLEPTKSEGPVPMLVVLGLPLSCPSHGGVGLHLDARKREAWVVSIVQALSSDALSPVEAAQLVGRLSFDREWTFT